MASKQQKKPIYEKRYEEMLTPSDHKTTLRNAHFLNPLSTPNQDASFSFPPNTTPLLSEIFSHDLQQWPSNVIFKAWYGPQKKWKCWVHQLAPKYSTIWTQCGIHGAIMASVYEVRSSPDIVLGLSEFWCPDTNTFVFPWGEATITLEDVMILGGHPVLGECLTSSAAVTKKLAKLEKKFKDYKLEILSKGIKATHFGWLDHFMEDYKESNGDLVHVAFLCIWLSRYVFPSAGTCIVNSLIPIAVKLSLGFKLALGPAVLASLYRNLSILSKQAVASKQNMNVSGSFQLLQIWAFERFPILGPKASNLSHPGEPRMARWNKLNLKLNLPLVRMAVKEAKNFCWRPYAAILKNWNPPSYYKENEQCFSDCSSLDEELRSFYRFLLASELVGIDCREKYFPHRIAMQFGIDQDIPANISIVNYSAIEPVKLFVPSRSFQPSVSLGYSNWWKDLMLAREDKFKDVLLRKDSDQASSSIQAEGNSQDCHATVAPNSEDSSVSSFETLPPGTSTYVPLTSTTSANNDEAGEEDRGVPVEERNPTDFPTTPPIINESNSMVSPPPGFKNLSSCAENRERLFESSCADFDSPSLPFANNAKVSSMKKEPLVSSKAKTHNTGLPDDTVPKNMVKREALSDDDDDVIILHLDKKETNVPKTCNPSHNVAFSDMDASSGSRKRKLYTRESPEVSIAVTREALSDDDDDVVLVLHLNKKETAVKNFLKSSEGKAQETAKGVDENVCTFASNATGFSKKIKNEAGNSVDEPFEIDDVRVGIGASCPINPKGDSDLITPNIPFDIRNQIVQDWSDDDELHPVRANISHARTSAAVLLSQSKEPITLSSSESNDSEDLYDDHAPIAACFRKPRHASPTAAPPKLDADAASSRKRKLSSRNEGTSQKEVTFQSSVKAAAKGVKGGESGESTETFCFVLRSEDRGGLFC